MKDLTDEEMKKLEDARSVEEWNLRLAEIKGERNGLYPADWWPRVVESGLAQRKSDSFGNTGDVTKLTITPLQRS